MLLQELVAPLEKRFAHRDVISMADLSKSDIEAILNAAQSLQQQPRPDLLLGKILAVCFFEPSTRTRLSFETAMLRLGGSVIGFSEASTTSAQKGESLSDSMKIIGSYADAIVIRHPAEGSARLAAEAADIPVINGGDGANQHPTQTLVDLFTIRQLHGTLDNLHIALAGDLKYGRTIHSLAIGLSHYHTRLYFISPPELSLPEETADALRKAGVKFSYHTQWADILPKLDIAYMTRLQKERHLGMDYQSFVLREADLQGAKDSLRILHPLPRVGELDPAIDSTKFAAYFTQAANGVFVRQALLAKVLGAL